MCSLLPVIAMFRKKPRQSILVRTALDCFALRCKSRNDIGFVLRPLSLRGFARNRGNPFCKEPHWIASPCVASLMTSDLFFAPRHCEVSQETAAIHFAKNRTGLLRLALQVSQ